MYGLLVAQAQAHVAEKVERKWVIINALILDPAEWHRSGSCVNALISIMQISFGSPEWGADGSCVTDVFVLNKVELCYFIIELCLLNGTG